MAEYSGRLKVKFPYPDLWRIKELNDNLMELRAPTSGDDPFQEQIHIATYISDLEVAEKMENWIKTTRQDFEEFKYGNNEENAENQNMGTAREVIYTHKSTIDPSITVKGKYYLAKRGNQFLSLDLVAQKEEYDNYIGTFERIKRQIDFT
jgi:hypothetical protein